MKTRFRVGLAVLAAVCIFGVSVERSQAAVTISGVSGAKYAISPPIIVSSNVVFRISFENKTSGTNLVLCAGTTQDFEAGRCPLQLSSSGGPGFQFLTIVEGNTLNGKLLYVIRSVGNVNSGFVLTIE